MAGVRLPGRKAHQPHYYAYGLSLGRAFSLAGGGSGPGNLPQTLGRRLPSAMRLCYPASRSDFGIFEEDRRQRHSRLFQAMATVNHPAVTSCTCPRVMLTPRWGERLMAAKKESLSESS